MSSEWLQVDAPFRPGPRSETSASALASRISPRAGPRKTASVPVPSSESPAEAPAKLVIPMFETIDTRAETDSSGGLSGIPRRGRSFRCRVADRSSAPRNTVSMAGGGGRGHPRYVCVRCSGPLVCGGSRGRRSNDRRPDSGSSASCAFRASQRAAARGALFLASPSVRAGRRVPQRSGLPLPVAAERPGY